jgi:condensin complex subunit 1
LFLIRRYPDSAASDIPIALRQTFIQKTIERLKDKKSNVRKKAIELLVEFLKNNPFNSIDDEEMGSLSFEKFDKHQKELFEILKSKYPQEMLLNIDPEQQPVTENEDFEAVEPSNQELLQLKKLLEYYQDAKIFSKSMNDACLIVAELLQSTLKTQVIIAIKFFSVAHRFELENAKVGVLKMVHKIWDKDVSEKEENSVRGVLQAAFYDIHMNPPQTTDKIDEKIAFDMLEYHLH